MRNIALSGLRAAGVPRPGRSPRCWGLTENYVATRAQLGEAGRGRRRWSCRNRRGTPGERSRRSSGSRPGSAGRGDQRRGRSGRRLGVANTTVGPAAPGPAAGQAPRSRRRNPARCRPENPCSPAPGPGPGPRAGGWCRCWAAGETGRRRRGPQGGPAAWVSRPGMRGAMLLYAFLSRTDAGDGPSPAPPGRRTWRLPDGGWPCCLRARRRDNRAVQAPGPPRRPGRWPAFSALPGLRGAAPRNWPGIADGTDPAGGLQDTVRRGDARRPTR